MATSEQLLFEQHRLMARLMSQTTLSPSLHPFAAVVEGIRVAWFTNQAAAEATAKHMSGFYRTAQLVTRTYRLSWAVVDERNGCVVAGTAARAGTHGAVLA